MKRLHMMVEEIKASEQMGVTYMKMEERERLVKEEAIERGLREGRIRGREEGREEGRKEGIEAATDRINRLNKHLIQDGRIEDLRRSLEDIDYQKKLIEEYNIV